MPANEQLRQPYWLLKVGNLESSKTDHFRPDPVPFDRPLTTCTMRKREKTTAENLKARFDAGEDVLAGKSSGSIWTFPRECWLIWTGMPGTRAFPIRP
jgi:hypothetical protein